MKHMIFEAKNPAPGVVVMPTGYSGCKGLRKHQMPDPRNPGLAGPMPLGRTCVHGLTTIRATKGAPKGTVRPASKRRGHKRGPLPRHVFGHMGKSLTASQDYARGMAIKRAQQVSRIVQRARRAIRKFDLPRIARLESVLLQMAPQELPKLEQYARTCRRW